MSFNYGDTDAWVPSTSTILPPGNYVGWIDAGDMGEARSSGNPQLHLELRDEATGGTIQDWISITPKTINKVVAVFDATGQERPAEGEFNPQTGALTDACVNRIVGRKVGFVVREEADLKDPQRMRSRVQGYLPVGRIDQATADIPADTRGLPNAGNAGAASAQKPIPF